MQHNNSLDSIKFSAFVDIDQKIAATGIRHFRPLHQGKTTFAPPLQLHDWSRGEFDILSYQHASPAGVSTLRSAIRAFQLEQFGRDVAEEQIQIANGGTHAMSVALHAILQPGDEVLVLSPQWLFANGLVRAAGGVPVEVPVFTDLCMDAHFDFIQAIGEKTSHRTRAIYFNNPNNPTGYTLTEVQLASLADYAEQKGLWLLSDNAYEMYHFGPGDFVDISKFGAAGQRTLSIHSFSKTFAMPGYRVGYLISPPSVAANVRKWSLHSVYSVATPCQYMAHQALQHYESIRAPRRAEVFAARNHVHESLKVPHTSGAGGLYSFLDLRQWRDGGAESFLDAVICQGVSLAPGIVFGGRYASYARLCFTAVPLPALKEAVQILNQVYEVG